MTKNVALIELRSMQVADLTREVRGLRNDVAKMKIGIKMGKQKDTGGYRSAKRQLARMLTVLTMKNKTDERKEKTEKSSSSPSSKASVSSTSSKRKK
ncbi:MAG: 50S ribosomal protein L29 [Candidatus Peribacteraceae bacterium]|nr:50S ribosomal protein L29 [Candidatus Peribacteraceae bacterium]